MSVEWKIIFNDKQARGSNDNAIVIFGDSPEEGVNEAFVQVQGDITRGFIWPAVVAMVQLFCKEYGCDPHDFGREYDIWYHANYPCPEMEEPNAGTTH